MLALCLLIISVPQPLPAADAALTLEYRIKAGYLYNLAKFVEWPNPPSSPERSPIRIGVVGGAEILPILQQVLQGKLLEERPIELTPVAKPAADTGCHILFIHHSFGQSPVQIWQALSNAPVLLVGESEQFAEQGGMIGFVRESNSFRIHLNLETASRAHLKVSAKLSSVARMVKGRQQP